MGSNSRERNAKLNIYVSLLCQIITMICGLITPRYMLKAFGSEANGAITSISTFLGYIMLLEGGIGGVARAALYGPIAKKDDKQISEVMAEIRTFFYRVGYAFIAYVIVIACSFKTISHSDVFDWTTSFFLVIIISVSTFAQYFVGISNAVLLSASQKQYIANLFSLIGIVLNTVFVVILTSLGSNLITVKIMSSIVYSIRPIALWLYVRRKYNITRIKTHTNVLKDKWTGLGQHIAYFLHSHTDVVVLTLFGNLKAVSVYGVYYMVTSAVQNIATSFSVGMEAVFGDMYAKKEMETLNRTFGVYDTLVSIISTTLFGTTLVMIIPFIRLYTHEITDANYIEPLFGTILVCACLLHCLRAPYHSMIIAAGHFRQTRFAAYGEAAINLVSSIILVIRFGIVGAAVGTVAAILFRFVYYAIYLSRNIIERGIHLWIKRECINLAVIFLISRICSFFFSAVSISWDTYVSWITAGFFAAVCSLAIVLTVNYLFYKDECRQIIRRINIRAGKSSKAPE